MNQVDDLATLTVRTGSILKRLGMSFLSPGPELIDWYEIAGVAMDFVGPEAGVVDVSAETADEFAGYVNQIVPVVAEFTGLELKRGISAPAVFNRHEWIAITTENIKPVLENMLPGLIGSFQPGRKKPKFGRLVKMAITTEIGLMLGYLSTRVLGQYDLAIMKGEDTLGSLYFIYPNILQAESRLGFDKRAFRLWLTLHEVTHSYEFEANTWLKSYLRSLIENHARYVEAKLGRMSENAMRTSGEQSDFFKMAFQKSMRGLISPDENPYLAKTQTVMSILEGYSEFVMEMVGAEIVDGSRDIKELLDHARANRNWIHKAVERLIGLELKLQQYRLGHTFMKKAVDAGGMELANRVWEGPDNLPTLTELRRPELWITRMLR